MSCSSSPLSSDPPHVTLHSAQLHPADLRHMTSNTILSPTVKEHRAPTRASQHRVGSRSPSSIPSSPTSVHSSSSAIFERDIEPVVCPSPPHLPSHPVNPHRIPRSKATEQLEQSVPSVLDSAAAILTASVAASDDVAVVAPCLDPGRRSGFTSPIGSFRSRSPSPLGVIASSANTKSLLLGIPSPTSPTVYAPPLSNNVPPSPPATARPSVQTMNIPNPSPPSIVTPTSAYYSTTSSVSSSPKTTTLEHPPQALPLGPAGATTSHAPLPPSPTHNAIKRLSFMSYTDLLASTPASLVPLSSYTTSASSAEPPPHIPSVSGLTQASAAASIHGVHLSGAGPRDSIAIDDIGGEWEREGLGKGLEERLEVLMATGKE